MNVICAYNMLGGCTFAMLLDYHRLCIQYVVFMDEIETDVCTIAICKHSHCSCSQYPPSKTITLILRICHWLLRKIWTLIFLIHHGVFITLDSADCSFHLHVCIHIHVWYGYIIYSFNINSLRHFSQDIPGTVHNNDPFFQTYAIIMYTISCITRTTAGIIQPKQSPIFSIILSLCLAQLYHSDISRIADR